MTRFRPLLLQFLLLISLPNFAKAQGCSDAGFCTINSLKPNYPDSIDQNNNAIKIGGFYGNADQSIAAYGAYLEYNRQIGEKLSIDIKLTTLAQNGNGISTFGLSDIYANASYNLAKKLWFSGGLKIPLSDASKSLNELPLPMDYQSSLGTVDLVLGIGYEIMKIQIVAGLQQPLSQNNNQFFSSAYPENSELNSFQSTNKFIRSGDVMLRVSYPISIGQKFKLTPSLLPIYHLANDKYTDENNLELEIAGSQGLTLNGNLYLDYQLNQKNSIQLNLAVPFIVRESRPDGLTRSSLINLEYRINF